MIKKLTRHHSRDKKEHEYNRFDTIEDTINEIIEEVNKLSKRHSSQKVE